MCLLPDSRGQSHTQQSFPDLGIPQLHQPGCSGYKQQIPIVNHLSKKGKRNLIKVYMEALCSHYNVRLMNMSK